MNVAMEKGDLSLQRHARVATRPRIRLHPLVFGARAAPGANGGRPPPA